MRKFRVTGANVTLYLPRTIEVEVDDDDDDPLTTVSSIVVDRMIDDGLGEYGELVDIDIEEIQ